MKHVFVLAAALSAFAAVAPAQDATPKPARKNLTFEPGASTPNPAKSSTGKATPKATSAATPASSPKPDTKAADAKSAAAKAAALAAEHPEDAASPAIVTSTVPPEPAQIVRAFFAMLGKGDIDGAYANLMKGSRIAERPEEVKTLKAKTKEAIDVFGVVHGYDLVEIKNIGERLMRATYLSLGHELPLRWRFYFYKAETTWKLIDIRVDDKLTGIFDEAMEEVPRNSDAKP